VLPKQVTDLTDSFVKVFDSERPQERQFKRAHDKTAAFILQKGLGGWCGFALGPFAQEANSYLQQRANFVRDKLQQSVDSTQIEFYPELNADLKSCFMAHLNPSVKAAETYFEMLRQSANASPTFTERARTGFENIVLRINAELDLFAAEYGAKRKNDLTAKQTINIGTMHGPVGKFANCQVNVYDYSSVNQLLIDHQIPKHDRRELEDIVDEMKDAPPEKKTPLLARAEAWVVKHKELLGVGVEAVGRVIGAAGQHPPKP
jgi:hypothetical protein